MYYCRIEVLAKLLRKRHIKLNVIIQRIYYQNTMSEVSIQTKWSVFDSPWSLQWPFTYLKKMVEAIMNIYHNEYIKRWQDLEFCHILILKSFSDITFHQETSIIPAICFLYQTMMNCCDSGDSNRQYCWTCFRKRPPL